MNPNDPHVDRTIGNALRAEAGEPYAGSLETLAARIDVAAAPLLAARRGGSATRPFAWWDYAAEWARTLIPASVVVAAASVGFLWLLRIAQAEPVSRPSAIIAAVRPCAAGANDSKAGCTPAAAVDRAVEELVSSVDVPPGRTPR